MHGERRRTSRAAGVTGLFDGILAAYLLRNLPEPNAALRSFHALLKPGAPLAVHEYSVADSARSKADLDGRLLDVIIPMGKLRSGSAELYRTCGAACCDFDGVEALAQRMRDAGFVDVRCQTFAGWQQDIVHTILGRRAPEPEIAAAARRRLAEAGDATDRPAG